jgi:hypothetical protein
VKKYQQEYEDVLPTAVYYYNVSRCSPHCVHFKLFFYPEFEMGRKNHDSAVKMSTPQVHFNLFFYDEFVLRG